MLTSGLLAAFLMLPASLLASSMSAPEDATQDKESNQAEETEPTSLRERMQERRQQRRSELGDTESELAARRSDRQHGRGNWWEDEAIAESLELSEDQQSAIAELHDALQSARREERQQQSQQRQGVPEAFRANDRSAVEDLLEKRSQASRNVHQAESEWLLGLMEALDEDQLDTLASEHPRALTGQATGGRR